MTTTRYYKVNGEYHTYDWLHDNLGYTKTATTSVTYKTTDPWGGTASSSGYSDHPSGVYDFDNFSFFVSGVVGWHSPNALALEGYYPSDSTEFLVIKDGVVSNATRYDDAETGIQDEFYYLVEADINIGWMTQSEFDQSGWVEYISGEPIGGDISATTDNVIHVDFGPGLVSRGGYAYPDGNLLGMQWNFGGEEESYTPDEEAKGYIVVDSTGAIQHSIPLSDMFIHQIQHSVDVVNFYFTSNGAAETENSELESGVDVPLYNADGTVANDDLYDGAGTLTYTQANGNMFEAADGGDLIVMQSGALVMNPNADYKALSVQVEKVDSTTLDMILALKWDKDNDEWKTVAFNQPSDDNFWWNGLLSENDKTKVINLGLSTALDNLEYHSFGDIGAIVWDKRYTFEVIDLYNDLGQTSVPGYDLSTLRTSYRNVNGDDILVIWSDVQDNTPVMAWKCRIKKLPSLEIVVGVRWDPGTNNWIAPSFSGPDWFYAGILDPADITTLANFGLSVSTEPGNAGPNGNILYSNDYYYDILELYSDLGSTISSYTNMSNLTMGSQSFSLGDILSIKNVSAINSGLIMSYKLRITQNPRKEAYFTSAGANNQNTDVGRNSNYYLYDANGQRLNGDSSKTYTITGVYTAGGMKLETSSSDFIQVSAGKLLWYSNVLPSTGTFYYAYRLTYTES